MDANSVLIDALDSYSLNLGDYKGDTAAIANAISKCKDYLHKNEIYISSSFITAQKAYKSRVFTFLAKINLSSIFVFFLSNVIKFVIIFVIKKPPPNKGKVALIFR